MQERPGVLLSEMISLLIIWFHSNQMLKFNFTQCNCEKLITLNSLVIILNEIPNDNHSQNMLINKTLSKYIHIWYQCHLYSPPNCWVFLRQEFDMWISSIIVLKWNTKYYCYKSYSKTRESWSGDQRYPRIPNFDLGNERNETCCDLSYNLFISWPS